MQSTNPRNQFLDYTKGILIFLVVYGHILQYIVYSTKGFYQDPIFKAIYIFHMPLFIAVSGFVSFPSIHKSPFRSLAKKRFLTLVVPIVAWAVLYTLVFLCIGKEASLRQFLHDIVANTVGGFWFLWVLFGAIIAIALLRRFGQDTPLGMLLAFGVLLLLPDKGNLFLFKYLFPFFCGGYLAAKWQETPTFAAIKSNRFFLPAVSGAAILGYVLWNTKTYIYVSGMHDPWSIALRYFAGFAACILVMWMNWKLYQISTKPLRSLVGAIGKGSLYIYILSSYLFMFSAQFQYPLSNNVLLLLSIYPIAAFLLSVGLLQLGNLAERNPWIARFLFGRVTPPQPSKAT